MSAAAFANFLVFGSRQRIGNAIHDHLRQLETQLSGTGNPASFIDVGDPAAHVCTARNNFHTTLQNRLVEYGNEGFADFVLSSFPHKEEPA